MVAEAIMTNMKTLELNEQQEMYLKWLLEQKSSEPDWQISKTDKIIVDQILSKLENK